MITRLNGKKVSRIGIGTWGMGGWLMKSVQDDDIEIKAIRYALDKGINFIDTAELYGHGHAEELVKEAIKGYGRDKLFITTKVSPSHLSRRGIRSAIKASLGRLGLKQVDLYLVHWPRPFLNMKEVIGTMEELVDDGSIASFGVSNFGVKDLKSAIAATKKYDILANQINYSPIVRECENDVVPFCEKNKISVIAYSPLAKGEVTDFERIKEVAGRIGRTPVQVSLAYLMRRSLPIPKAARRDHMDEILGALTLKLSDSDYKYLSEKR
jgi:diketogulonate reductase-like aldo/keto reductase